MLFCSFLATSDLTQMSIFERKILIFQVVFISWIDPPCSCGHFPFLLSKIRSFLKPQWPFEWFFACRLRRHSEIQPLNTKNRISTGKYWDWASENKNCVKACEICGPTKLVWASSEHFWRFYGNCTILVHSRNSAEKQKITKMVVKPSEMVGFHF